MSGTIANLSSKFLLVKFYRGGYFNEVGDNSKQTIHVILFWPD